MILILLKDSNAHHVLRRVYVHVGIPYIPGKNQESIQRVNELTFISTNIFLDKPTTTILMHQSSRFLYRKTANHKRETVCDIISYS